MGNRKRQQDGEEDSDHDASDFDLQPKKTTTPKQSTAREGKAPSKPKTAKKPKFDEAGDESSSVHDQGDQQAVRVLRNAEGEKYVDLGKKKRAAVRSFKGQVFVDIREFYGTEGDEKPGKKGISLAMDQWEALKRSIGTIDSLFSEQGKK